jgi:hypothetical protein
VIPVGQVQPRVLKERLRLQNVHVCSLHVVEVLKPPN